MNEPSNSDSNGEIEPKPEVIGIDDNEDPTRKRARVTGSSEGSFDKLVAEAVEKALREKNIDESFHNVRMATLEVSDYTIHEVGKLEKKIQNMETENSELKQKMGQQEEQMEKLQKENLLNEIKNQKLKEYILKMKENLEGKVEKQEKIIEGFQKSLDEMQVKMADQDRNMKSCAYEHSIRKLTEEEIQLKLAIQELALEKMKTENLEWKQKLEENLKANRQLDEVCNLKEKLEKEVTRIKAQSSQISSDPTQPKAHLCTAVIQRNQAHDEIISSDNCNFPLTAAEQEYLNKCIFCLSKRHISMECKNYPKYYERRRIMHAVRRCMKCLDVVESMESHFCPRANIMCSNCRDEFHHPILCHLNDQSEDVKDRRQHNNKRRQSYGLPPRFVI